MKTLVLTVTLVALLAAAVFGGQAIASNKPADNSVSEETSEILFDWGGSYWGSPVRMQSFEGCFSALDYPAGYSGFILEESYPEVRHVSVTIIANGFDYAGDDTAIIYLYDCVGTNWWIDGDSLWPNSLSNFETFEFNTDHWIIDLYTTQDSIANYKDAVTVTFPR